jgi:hypothetical protein
VNNLSGVLSLLAQRTPDWIIAMVSAVLVEWEVAGEYELNSDQPAALEDPSMSGPRLELANILDHHLRQQFLEWLSLKKFIIKKAADVAGSLLVATPPWSHKERCERKIAATRGAQQDKVLLALGVLSGGQLGEGISSGTVKRYLRQLGQSTLADDATTFLSKLAEAGDLKRLEERLTRRETVFELTAEGATAISELLL